jgi:AAA+ superfamily predicted ATPase
MPEPVKILLDDSLLGVAGVDAKKTVNYPAGRLEETLAKYPGGNDQDSSRVLNSFLSCFTLYHALMVRLEGRFAPKERNFSVLYSLYVGASEARRELEEDSDSDVELMRSDAPSPFERMVIDTKVHHPKQACDSVLMFRDACKNAHLASRKGLPQLGREFFDALKDSAWAEMSGGSYRQSLAVAMNMQVEYRGKVVKGFDTGIDAKKVNNGKHGWDSIAGYGRQKEYFQRIQCRIQNIDRALEICPDIFALLPNVLMYGPPGTGKTKMAKVFASESGVRYFEIDLSSIASRYYNETAQNLAKKFDEASAVIKKGISRVAILYIDEITSVGSARFSAQGSKEDDKVTDTLLRRIGEETQTPGLMVIAGANTVSERIISPTLLSRFELLEFPVPDEATQSQIISLYQDHFTGNSPSRMFAGIDAGRMARLCVYADGSRLVPRHIRQVMARMARDVIDTALEGESCRIDEERFVRHLKAYREDRDTAGKRDYA